MREVVVDASGVAEIDVNVPIDDTLRVVVVAGMTSSPSCSSTWVDVLVMV